MYKTSNYNFCEQQKTFTNVKKYKFWEANKKEKTSEKNVKNVKKIKLKREE